MNTTQISAIDFSPSKKRVKIHRSPNGAVLGAVLWIPGEIIQPLILPMQDEIEVVFEEDRIIIGKETASYVLQAETREHQRTRGVHDIIFSAKA